MLMNYVSLNEIRDDLLKFFKNQNLYPIIGAGFSANCQTSKGVTPSGDMLKAEMLSQMAEAGTDTSTISSMDLKAIAKYYKKLVPRNVRTRYLQNNFTHITLPDYAVDFLKIKWKYIYTFNIDTGIEDNSAFKNIILPNKPCDEKDIKNMENCLFKVHGDVVDYCKYTDSMCYIFDNKEYAQSIKQNIFILNKMHHDFTFNNLIFIGCSLTDELDLLSLSLPDDINSQTRRYYVTDKRPDGFKEIDLKEYGITDIILIDNYSSFYRNIYKIFLESEKLQSDELDNFKNIKLNFSENNFDKNINYLCLGKSIFDTHCYTLRFPYFFIDRTLVFKKIIPEMSKYTIQFICGGRVSGKTYALASIIKNIRDRDVYFFDSRYSLNSDTLNKLIEKKNSVICFDTTSISKEQIYYLKENIYNISKNTLNIVVCINASDKDVISSIKRMADSDQIFLYDMSNKLDTDEHTDLNDKLSQLTIPSFDIHKSLLDNLLIISDKHAKKYMGTNFKYEANNTFSMSILILLAIKEKITSQEFVDFGIEREVYDLLHKLTPIVDEDYTNIIERDSLDSSSCKIYANSRYWLLNKLGSYASDYAKHQLIVESYHNIISHLIKNHNIRYNSIEDYIKYDIINDIFFRPDRGNLSLIKSLYDDLNDLLFSNPQFHHQRAKCYLWHCNYSSDPKAEISDALRFAKLAKHNLELTANINNPKVIIALAHIDFTLALIYAKTNFIHNYTDARLFKECLPYLKCALDNPYNKEYFYTLLGRNNKKIDDINRFVTYATTKDLSDMNLSSVEQRMLNDIITIVISTRQ